MRASIRLLIVGCLFFASVAFAVPKVGSTVRISLASGRTVTGTLAGETSAGLLVTQGGKTEMVPYAEVRLLEELGVVGSDAPAQAQPQRQLEPVDDERTEALRIDIRNRQRELPGLGAPITLLSIGGVFVPVGVVLTVLGSLSREWIPITVGGCLLGIGLGTGIAGAVLLGKARARRSELEQLKYRLEDLDGHAAAPRWLKELAVALY